MSFSGKFFKTVAVCAFISGVLILVSLVLSFFYPMPMSMDSALALKGNATATAGLWIWMVSLVFIIISMWGVAARKLETAAGLVTTGFIFFLADFILELINSGITIFPWDKAANAYYAAADPAKQAVMKENILACLFGLPDALWFSSMICFLIGLLLFGLATWKGKGIEKTVSAFFFLSAITIVFFLFIPMITMELLINLIFWICPLVWVVKYLLIGAWLWQGAK